MSGLSGLRVEWAPVPDGADRRGVAWSVLREIVGDPAAVLTNRCPRCGGPHGPVRIEGGDVHASVTYAGGFAIAGVVPAEDAGAVGLDAEPETDLRRDAAGLTGIVAAGVVTTVREWTRIEAVLKASGEGLRRDPATVQITVGPHSWAATDATGARYAGRDLEAPPGVILSAAIAARNPEPRDAARADPAVQGGRATR